MCSIALPAAAAAVSIAIAGATVHAQSCVNGKSPHVHPVHLTPDWTRPLAVNTADNRREVFDITSRIPIKPASVPVGLDRADAVNPADVAAFISVWIATPTSPG